MTPLQRAAHHRAEARKALAEQQQVTGTKRYRSNNEIAGTVRRFARTLGQRVADGDPEDLQLLMSLRNDLDEAITAAMQGQLEQGRSLQDIGTALGVSRNAVSQRLKRRAA
jgi:DNA-directed RNA polymerase specialized sigma24 family protein